MRSLNPVLKDQSLVQFDHLFPCLKAPASPQQLITGFSESFRAVLSLTLALQDWHGDVIQMKKKKKKIRKKKYHFHRNYSYQTMHDCKIATYSLSKDNSGNRSETNCYILALLHIKKDLAYS